MKPDATARPHVSVRTSYVEEVIECSCGSIVTAEPDTFNHDSHSPLIREWERHRREAGLTKGSGTGWSGSWSPR